MTTTLPFQADAAVDGHRTSLVVRVLGIYIAAAAGAIQLFDVVVDRAGIPDRVFAFAVVLAVVGMPVAVLAAFVAQLRAAEHRRPSRPRSGPVTVVRSAVARTRPEPAEAPAVNDDIAATLQRRLQLALSYRCLAVLHRESGSTDEAVPHSARFIVEIEQIIADLDALARAESSDPTNITGGIAEGRAASVDGRIQSQSSGRTSENV